MLENWNIRMGGKEDGIPQKSNFLLVGIAAYCYMTKIFVFLWEFFFFLKVGVGYYSCLRFLIGV